MLVLRGHTLGVTDARFSPDGRRILTTGFDRTVRIWDAVRGQRLNVLRVHRNAVLAAGFMIRGHKGGLALATAELRVSAGPFSWSSDLNARWWGEVGDARFGMDRLQQERLHNGAVYRVWWLPLDGHAWVQSIERV